MISISEAVRDLVMQRPFLAESLAAGIINLSALARKMIPDIEKKLLKNASEGAMVMALKRLADDLAARKSPEKPFASYFTEITVRSRICEFTFQKSAGIIARQREILSSLQDNPDTFITFTTGVREITLLSGQDNRDLVMKTFAAEKLISSFSNLAAITMRLTEDSVITPGIYHAVLNRLAWQDINVVEVVSTYLEFILIIREEQVEKAFSAMKQAVWN